MTLQHLDDPNIPLGDLLKRAGSEGLLIESRDRSPYALMPLDDDLIDYLIERDPKLIRECRDIRERMRAGKFRTHEQVSKLLTGK